MSFKSSSKSSNLEKYYYNNIYKNSSNSIRGDDNFYLPTPNQYSLTTWHNSSQNSSFYYTKSLKNEKPKKHKSQSRSLTPYMDDDTENESIVYSIRKLGIESPSITSIKNLRSHSYMFSRENDCIETLLLQMQTDVEPNKEEVPTEKLSEPLPKKTSKIFKCNRKCWRKICCSCWPKIKKIPTLFKPIDFQSQFYLLWLGLVSIAYIYNLISISLRYSFEYDNNEIEMENIYDDGNFTQDLLFSYENSTISNNTSIRIEQMQLFMKWIRKNRTVFWLIADYFSDFIYLVDIFLVQTRIKFIQNGLWVLDIKLTSLNYFKSSKFYVIILLQFFYLIY